MLDTHTVTQPWQQGKIFHGIVRQGEVGGLRPPTSPKSIPARACLFEYIYGSAVAEGILAFVTSSSAHAARYMWKLQRHLATVETAWHVEWLRVR